MGIAYFIECSAPHWLDVAKFLGENGHVVSRWTAWCHAEAAITAIQTCTFHDTIHAKRGLDPNGNEPVGFMFDAVCESVWRDEAQVIYDQMNRFDTSLDLSIVERSLLLYRMLVYWRHVLDQDHPDLVVFPAPPHVIYDYVLLCLCRRLGIKTLMFEEATIHAPYSLTMDDYAFGDRKLAATVHRTCAEPRSEAVARTVEKLRGSYEIAKPYREVEAHRKRKSATRFGFLGFFATSAQWLYKITRARILSVMKSPHLIFENRSFRVANLTSLCKERGKSLRQSFEGPFSNFRYARLVIDNYFAVRRLEKAYNGLCVTITDSDKRFVYFPLPGQPERTSNPQADIFTNLVLLANVIANNLPEGWLLVIKEHPNQFDPNFISNPSCRSEELYLAMACIPKTLLVRNDTDPFMLIDKSSGVATTGGTAALEAIARNKPALLFGDAWYRDCPGVSKLLSHQDYASIPDILLRGLSTGPEGLEHFLAAVEASCGKFMADYPPSGYQYDPAESTRTLQAIVAERLETAAQSRSARP